MQYLGELGTNVDVSRNDTLSMDEIAARSPDAVVVSPGPGVPSDAGLSVALVGWCARTATPLLGVCLGHQAIAVAFGGRVVPAPTVMHGKTSQIHHSGVGVLSGLDNPFEAGRYHSLMIDGRSLPADLEVTAWTEDRIVMGVRHSSLRIEGVQFHPESILTGAAGKRLLQNFLDGVRRPVASS